MPSFPDSSGLSTVVVRLIEYERLQSTARAYSDMQRDVFPLLVLYAIVLAAFISAMIYWWWRAKSAEEILESKKQPMPQGVDPMASVFKAIRKKMREGRRC